MSGADPPPQEVTAFSHLTIDDLSNSQKLSIQTALRSYRDTVLRHNLSLLKHIVAELQNDPNLEDEDPVDHFPHHLFQAPLPNGVADLQDLLAHDELLQEYIETQELDGISHDPADRTQWFSLMQEEISTGGNDVVPFPPPELEYLCTLVPAIVGAGLPFYRFFERVAFLSTLDPLESPSLTRARTILPLKDPNSSITPLWDGWEITVACKIGENPERSWSGSYVLWCRNEMLGRDWAWRYGMRDELWESEVFDTIEEVLEWYARHGET